MFTNNGYGWKLGIALAIITALAAYCGNRGQSINPAVWQCLAEPERWKGTEIWTPGGEIIAIEGDEFVVTAPPVILRVRGAAPGKLGTVVSLRGTFENAGGPHLRLTMSRVMPERSKYRWISEALSVLIFLLILANFLRHFAFRKEVLQIAAADEEVRRG